MLAGAAYKVGGCAPLGGRGRAGAQVEPRAVLCGPRSGNLVATSVSSRSYR